MASQITSVSIVYPTVCSGADQRKDQSSAPIHRWPVNSLHKRPVMWKMFPFDDVIMSKPKITWINRRKCYNSYRLLSLLRAPTTDIRSSTDVPRRSYEPAVVGITSLISQFHTIYCVTELLWLSIETGDCPDSLTQITAWFSVNKGGLLRNKFSLKPESCSISRGLCAINRHRMMTPRQSWRRFPQYCPDNKVYGSNMGPTWGRQDPGGPHVGPMNFAIWMAFWVRETTGYR